MDESPSRICSSPEVCSGKPVIRGTRIMVRNIMSMLSAGYTFERILDAYPGLARQDIEAVILEDE